MADHRTDLGEALCRLHEIPVPDQHLTLAEFEQLRVGDEVEYIGGSMPDRVIVRMIDAGWLAYETADGDGSSAWGCQFRLPMGDFNGALLRAFQGE